MKKKVNKLKKLGQWESPRYLFPEKVGQTEGATTATTQDDQANECDWTQGHVGNHRGYETKRAGNDLVTPTAVYRRIPFIVNLRMR